MTSIDFNKFLLYTQKVTQRFSLNYVGYTAKVE